MLSDIKPNASSTWSFSSQAIRVMDLATLDPVAPDPYIHGCAPKGCYWTLSYTKGVRLRVAPINSDAGWSAIESERST